MREGVGRITERGRGGFSLGSCLPTWHGAERPRILFVRHQGIGSINMPFIFRSMRGTVGEAALVDSGASENFIDQRTAERWGIATCQLPIPVQVTNVDGTNNRSGAVT
jgi:Aspartyl protease